MFSKIKKIFEDPCNAENAEQAVQITGLFNKIMTSNPNDWEWGNKWWKSNNNPHLHHTVWDVWICYGHYEHCTELYVANQSIRLGREQRKKMRRAFNFISEAKQNSSIEKIIRM